MGSNINKNINFIKKLFLFSNYIINIKIILSISFILCIITIFLININYKLLLNNYYNDIQKNMNISFGNEIKKKIRIAIYCYCLKNGGRARITSKLLNYLNKIKIFELFLFTQISKETNEYFIPKKLKRIVIKNNLLKFIKKNKINVLIYELSNENEIILLNKLKNIKVIYFLHSSAFYWIYFNYTNFKSIYKAYKNSNYVISIIPFENDFIFNKWGIRSILFNNFITYEYDKVIPSNLSSKLMLMIGRGNNKLKRFEIGIRAMEYIIQEFPESQLIIISNLNGTDNLRNLINMLDLKNNIKFVGYTISPEIYYKNTILHIFPSITEAFPLVLSETKIYGIPNILIGLDYVSLSKKGTIINYNDGVEEFALEIIKFLKNHLNKRKLSLEARKSMKKYNNQILLKKWIILILSIYNGYQYYENLRNKQIKISNFENINILKNQIKFLNLRMNLPSKIKINDYLNLTFLDNLYLN